MSLLYVKTSKEANAVGTLWDRGRGILLSEKGCQGRVLRSTVTPWPVCVAQLVGCAIPQTETSQVWFRLGHMPRLTIRTLVSCIWVHIKASQSTFLTSMFLSLSFSLLSLLSQPPPPSSKSNEKMSLGEDKKTTVKGSALFLEEAAVRLLMGNGSKAFQVM